MNWKAAAGVIISSGLLIGLAVAGLGRMSGGQVAGATVEVQGEARLVKGGSEARVTVVEFSDFQCPACGEAVGVVKALADQEGVRVVYRHLPLSTIHKNALVAAEAAEAANAQGKFWEYHDMLFEDQAGWKDLGDPKDRLVGYAVVLGLDETRFRQELEEGRYKETVLADYREAIRLGINATPSFVVNGRMANLSNLAAVVEEELAKK